MGRYYLHKPACIFDFVRGYLCPIPTWRGPAMGWYNCGTLHYYCSVGLSRITFSCNLFLEHIDSTLSQQKVCTCKSCSFLTSLTVFFSYRGRLSAFISSRLENLSGSWEHQVLQNVEKKILNIRCTKEDFCSLWIAVN